MFTVGTIGLSLTRLAGGGMVGNEKKETALVKRIGKCHCYWWQTQKSNELALHLNLLFQRSFKFGLEPNFLISASVSSTIDLH